MPEIYDRCLGPFLFAPYAVHVAEAVVERRRSGCSSWLPAPASSPASWSAPAAAPRSRPPISIRRWWHGAQSHVPGADWQVADAQDLGFAAASFDLVVCQFGVMFFPDRPRAFGEMARVLTPDGGVRDRDLGCSRGIRADGDPRGLPGRVFPDDPPSFIVRIPHGYTDPDQISADLIAGGLAPVGIERVQLRGRSASAATVAEGFCLGGPMRFELEQRGSYPSSLPGSPLR